MLTAEAIIDANNSTPSDLFVMREEAANSML